MRRLRIPFTFLLVFALLGGALFAQGQGNDPRIARARASYGTGRFDEGITLLQEVLKEQPENPLATHLIGYGLHVAGRRAEALEWHTRATKYPSVAGPSHYNVACVHALEGRKDDAFAALKLAREAGFSDKDLAESDSDLESLHGDARYAAFLKSFDAPTAVPAAARAIAPFPAEVRVLHAIEGEAPGDQFGWIARKIGDVNGDGAQDFVTSAPSKAQNGAGAGRVYVFSGRTAERLWVRDGAQGSLLGLGLEAAGDVDGDGNGDVIAGAPGVDIGDSRAFVFSGKNGEILLELSSGEGGDRFGRSVAGVGDLNGDGKSELLVGAPRAQEGGRAYLFSGSGQRLATLAAEADGHAFGSCVAGGDGFLMVGARDAGSAKGGRVYVYRWREGGPRHAFLIDGDEHSQELGAMFLSVVGDANGDGTSDLYASDWSSNAGGTSAGRIHLHSGADGALLRTISGSAAGECFGIGAARLGDWNQDGCDDLVVGAWRSAVSAPLGGRAAIHSGKTGEVLAAIPCSAENEFFGFDAEGLGDTNGDGRIDLLITGAWSACRGDKSGRIWLLSR